MTQFNIHYEVSDRCTGEKFAEGTVVAPDLLWGLTTNMAASDWFNERVGTQKEKYRLDIRIEEPSV